MKTEITQEIKEALKTFFWVDEEYRTRVSLGNARLDFKKDYYFEKFTKMGVRMYWMNGNERVYVVGHVEFSNNYADYAFYTEGWSYIEHFKLQGGKN